MGFTDKFVVYITRYIRQNMAETKRNKNKQWLTKHFRKLKTEQN